MGISARKIGNSATVLPGNLINNIQSRFKKAETEFVEAHSNSLMLIPVSRTQIPDIESYCCLNPQIVTLKKIRVGDIFKSKSILVFLRNIAANVVITHWRTENHYTNLGDH